MSKNTQMYTMLVVIIQCSLFITTTISKPVEDFDDEFVSNHQAKRCTQDCGGIKDQCLQVFGITNFAQKFECLRAENECRGECEGGRKREVDETGYDGDAHFFGGHDFQRFLSAARGIWGEEFEKLEEFCSTDHSVEEMRNCMMNVYIMKQASSGK